MNINNKEPLVSIVMPFYNSEKNIKRAIESILNQTYLNWELIVINDGSTDDSLLIVNNYLKNENIKIINRNTNLGIAVSRNEGINKAKGDYIAFLDSDDEWKPDKLQKQIQHMIASNIDFCCTSFYIKKNSKKKIFTKESRFYTYRDLLKNNFIGCLTVVVKSEIIKSNLMPTIRHEDYATWLNILKTGNRIFYLNIPLSTYYVNDESISSNKLKSIIWALEVIENQKNLSFYKKKYYQFEYLLFSFFKKIKTKQI